MTAANVPNEIFNLTPADAVPVNQNFQYLETFLNSEMINRDGSVAMTGPLTLQANPTNPLEAATKAYVDAFLPVGSAMLYVGTAAPAGVWMLARGQSLSTSAYPALFAVCGYRFGGSGGSFNLPDMRGRFPIGADPAVTEINETGKTGGTTTPTLPSHTHTMAHTHTHTHTHTINHDHPNVNSGNNSHSHLHSFSRTTSSAGTHTHTGTGSDSSIIVPSTGVGPIHAGGGNDMKAGSLNSAGAHTHTVSGNTGYQNSNHYHAVNIPNYAGSSGGASTSTTSGSSAANTGSAGTASATMRQPFTALNFIIRVA